MRHVLIGFAFGSLAAAVVKRYVSRRAPANEELSNLTKDELYKRAQAADVPHRSEMTKEQLIDALTER